MDGGNCSVGRPGLQPPCFLYELITWDGLGLCMSGRVLSVMCLEKVRSRCLKKSDWLVGSILNLCEMFFLFFFFWSYICFGEWEDFILIASLFKNERKITRLYSHRKPCFPALDRAVTYKANPDSGVLTSSPVTWHGCAQVLANCRFFCSLPCYGDGNSCCRNHLWSV